MEKKARLPEGYVKKMNSRFERETCEECGNSWLKHNKNKCTSLRCSIGMKNLREDMLCELDKQIDEATINLKNLIIKKKFIMDNDDVYFETARWGKECCCSRKVNSNVTDFEYRFNCGCCSDSPLEVFPYVMRGDVKIYSSPSCFKVGERNACGTGVVPYDNWNERLRKENISESVIEKIKQHLERHAPEDFDDDDDLDDLY